MASVAPISKKLTRKDSLLQQSRADVVMDKLWLNFEDPELEAHYRDLHQRRMRRGFAGTILTRSSLFLACGVLYLTIFDGLADHAGYMSFCINVFHVLIILVFRLTGGRHVQLLSALACSIEGTMIWVCSGMVSLRSDSPPSMLALQYFILSGGYCALTTAFGIQKISLLRLPYLVAVLIIITSCAITVFLLMHRQSDLDSPPASGALAMVLAFFPVAIMNGRDNDRSDRRLFITMEREKKAKADLAEQIKRTNKLARTVLMMSDGDDEGDRISSRSSVGGKKCGGNMVAEFDFFARLAQKVKESKAKLPQAAELARRVPAIESLGSAMKDPNFKKGFRYFCNEGLNLESLLFFEQVEQFRKQCKKGSQRICDTFVAAGSPSEINVSDAQRAECIAQSETEGNSFDEAQAEVFKMMSTDIFPRFKSSLVGRGLLLSHIDENFREFVENGIDAASTPVVERRKSSLDLSDNTGLESTSPSGFAGPRSLMSGMLGSKFSK